MGYAQPDHLLLCEKEVIIIESKLTQTESGISQLEQLYRPIIERIYSPLHVRTVMVCKNLRYRPRPFATNLGTVLMARNRGVLTWHWIG